MKKDLLTRFLIEESSIRGNIINLDKSLSNLTNSLKIPQTIMQSFVEIITACPMLTATLKIEGGLILQIQGNKDLKLIVAESDNHFNIRGTIKINQKTKLPFTKLVQDAIFVLTIIHKDQKTPYQGIIDVRSGSVKQMIEDYLTQSMQVKSKIFFYQKNSKSYAIFFQELPHKNDDHRIKTEKLWKTLEELECSILENAPEKVLEYLFPHEQIQLFENHPVKFKCSCSEEKIYKTISLLKTKDVFESLENNKMEMVCEYCQKKYTVTRADVEAIFSKNQALN